MFGSLYGTPIINLPQSAVLGMHAIKERPVVVDGQIVIRPIMVVALTYDHRLLDGREAVTFLGKSAVFGLALICVAEALLQSRSGTTWRTRGKCSLLHESATGVRRGRTGLLFHVEHYASCLCVPKHRRARSVHSQVPIIL